jgi:transposase-like protein
MTKSEQNRVLAWRLRVIREASDAPRNVGQTCRHFDLSRQTFYKWKARYKSHGDAGLCDRPALAKGAGKLINRFSPRHGRFPGLTRH